MSGLADAPGTRRSGPTAAAVRGLFRDRPIIPLLILLAILVVLSELVRPGIVSPEWIGVELRAAVPLAILAGCQTLTMLTGGIDLSVGAVASMAGFVTATFVNSPGGVPFGIAVALTAAVIAGLIALVTDCRCGDFHDVLCLIYADRPNRQPLLPDEYPCHGQPC